MICLRCSICKNAHVRCAAHCERISLHSPATRLTESPQHLLLESFHTACQSFRLQAVSILRSTDMKTTFVAAGDAFITRHLSDRKYSGFEHVRDLIARHDFRFCNLEMTFHRQEGYPAASSGGTWAMTDPDMLDDIASYGFNVYNTANNHSGDFGQEGVLATARHLKARKMPFAGKCPASKASPS